MGSANHSTKQSPNGDQSVAGTDFRERPGATDADAERETVIQFDDAHEHAVFYTHHRRCQRHLRRLGLGPVVDNKRGGLTFHVPQQWLRLPRPQRVASPAQRKALKEAAEARQQSRARS